MRCSREVVRSARRQARRSIAGARDGGQRFVVPLVPSPAVVGLAIDALPDSVHAEPDASQVSLPHRMPGLFRKEVLEARQAAVFGQVVLRPPLSFTIWCAAAAAIVTALQKIYAAIPKPNQAST